jgi:PHD/YefM family antitoxin component YafN of YafNO toxin-antitoxin module
MYVRTMDTFISVDVVTEARERLSQTVTRMAEQGIAAPPVVIGHQRRPEAVLISFALFERLYEEIDRIQAAHIAAARLRPISEEEAFQQLCQEMGVEPGQVRAQMTRDNADAADPGRNGGRIDS